MAKILCSHSNILFECSYLPIALNQREYAHPIFHLPQKKLIGLYQKYRHGELGPTEAYLTFLAFLNSTNLVEFRVPATMGTNSAQIIGNNFDDLVDVVTKMNCIKNPSIHFAHIAITPETQSLDNIKYWIESWKQTYVEFCEGYRNQKFHASVLELEQKLEHLIKDANRNEVKFAARLADWAEKVGSFPRFQLKAMGQIMICADYWKLIIRKCTNKESIFQIPINDIQELYDHCQDNIDAGSIYGFNLFKFLKEGLQNNQDYLGIGTPVKFSVISDSTSTEDANKAAIIAAAPDKEPQRIHYPSTLAYYKAKLAWDLKLSQGEDNETN